MLSPPEFHYNGVTLTLPAMNVSGNASVGGKGTATVSIKKKATVVQYPNTSCAGCANRTNPVNSSEGEKVYVNITSDYYDAWADYAGSLGYTNVSTNSINTTSIELKVVPSNLGASSSITNPITFRGLDPGSSEPLSNFSFKIKPSGNNLDWDIRVGLGNKKLIVFLKDTSWNVGDDVDLSIGYQHDGQGYAKPAEIWKAESGQKPKVQPDGYVYVDLLNKSFNLTYNSDTVGSTGSCTPSKITSGDFNSSDFSWPSVTINAGNQKDIYNITQHYIQLMAQEGDISFSQCNTGNGGIDAISTMLINYNAAGALTYLHITENRADVGIS
ncbi:MAG: hypothetical protein Q8N79_02425 [Candidatus Methanoperedens sp.]|nr:hypothetical protein [Candidatus Methanoperedens sp.]